MSEFLAEAQVLVRPNTALFRTQLQSQLLAATKGVVVPVAVTPIAAKGVATAAAATSSLAVSARAAALAEAELAGASAAASNAAKTQTVSTNRLNAALLGLRTAAGTSAIIGLNPLSLAAIVAGAAFAASAKNFAAFEQELATFRVTAGATAEQMRQIREQAISLGADVRLPAVSATDAAIALTELSKAGLSVQDAMQGAEGVLQLATAAQISNAEAALLAANALNSFGLAGDQASRVADTLANAANAAQGSISDIGIAMRQASAVARQVGLSLEDTTAILALFAKNGLSGSDAGTSLRVALIRLVAPTKAAAAEIQRLGLQIRDAQGNFRADVFAQFGDATRNLTPAARDAAAALIFGQDAIRAVSIGAREGAIALELMQFQIDQQGTAAELAAARTEGLAGSFAGLQSNAQNLSIAFGELASGPLKNVIEGFSALADSTTTAIGGIQGVEKAIDDFVASLPGGSEVNEFIDFFATPGKAFSETAKGLNQLISGSDEVSERLKRLRVQIEGLQSARALVPPEQIEVARTLTLQIERLKVQIADTKREAAGFDLTGPFTKTTDALQATLDNLIKVRDFRLAKGIVEDTSFLNQRIAVLTQSIKNYERAAKMGLGSSEDLRGGFKGIDAAARGAATGVGVLISALERLTRQSTILQDQLQKAQAEGATPQTQIGILQQDIAVQRQLIAEAERGGRAAGDITTIRKARAQIIADQNEIDSLQAGIVSDQKAAASASEQAARDVQEARDKQFQALADLFGGRQEDIENAIERAGIRGNIEAQIRLNKALIASLEKERKALLERLRTVKVSAEARKRIMEAINDALEEARQDALRLQQEQRDNIQDLLDLALQRADLRIRIAQARDDIAAELRARRARLAAITKELVRLKNAGKKGTLAWLELKAQQAEEIAAINDVAKQQKDKGKGAAEFFFEQLQAQQGFAANLMGNLITGPTQGLVGVPAPPGPGRGVKVAASAAEGKAAFGPTSGQANVTNDILLRILQQLKHLNGDMDNPEATRQRRKQHAVMDYDSPGFGGV